MNHIVQLTRTAFVRIDETTGLHWLVVDGTQIETPYKTMIEAIRAFEGLMLIDSTMTDDDRPVLVE